MPFARPEAYDGPRLPTPSPSLARLGAFPVQPEAGTWKAHELVKQKINELPDKKKTTKMDGPGTNLGPILLTPSSAPRAGDSPHEGTEVRLEPQHEPRPPSVQPNEKIREHTQKLKMKR